jgi:uncharacterized phage protein gp47/JayE
LGLEGDRLMPLSRPTLTEQRRQIRADLLAGIKTGLLRYSNIGILGDALAGVNEGQYEYLDWIAKQSVPFSATDEYLEAWAALKGIIRKPATAAAGAVTLSGVAGTAIPAGTALFAVDGSGIVTTADAAIGATLSVAVACTAAAAGAAGNAEAGAAYALTSPIAGVAAVATITAGLSGGGDAELDDELRSRMLIAFAQPAQGGAETDYEEWALAVPGVTRAWAVACGMGAGTVVVLFMMDDARAAEGGFPQGTDGVADTETRAASATGDQLLVADAIYPLRPVTALVYAAAPTANTIGLTIAGIETASATTKAAIATAFAAALNANAKPGGTTYISWIEAAIAAVARTAGFVITGITASAGTVTPGAAGNIVSNTGALPVPGAIVYS